MRSGMRSGQLGAWLYLLVMMAVLSIAWVIQNYVFSSVYAVIQPLQSALGNTNADTSLNYVNLANTYWPVLILFGILVWWFLTAGQRQGNNYPTTYFGG